MPVQSYNMIEVMAEACRQKSTDWETIAQNITAMGLDPTSATDIVNTQFGNVLSTNPNLGGGANVWYYPAETIETWNKNIGEVLGDSNLATVSRGKVSVPVSTSVSGGGAGGGTPTFTVSSAPKSGGLSIPDPVYLMAEVYQGIGCASAGIWLGKQIDAALYNLNPDYWDSIGLSSLNPETWASITSGDTSLGANLFNMVFGIDPHTGNTQAYMDSTALAYMAMVLAENSWFAEAGTKLVGAPSGLNLSPQYLPVNIGGSTVCMNSSGTSTVIDTYTGLVASYEIVGQSSPTVNAEYLLLYVSTSQNTVNFGTRFTKVGSWTNTEDLIIPFSGKPSYTYDNKTVWYFSQQQFNGNIVSIPNGPDKAPIHDNTTIAKIAWSMAYGDVIEATSIDGVSNQENATLPDTSTWDTPEHTLQSLQQQYPDSFSNPLTYDVVQPDGTVTTQQYIPVPMPSFDISTQTQPVSDIDVSSQAQPQIQGSTQTETSIDTLLDLLTKLLQQPQTETKTDTPTPPTNPPDTGSGTTPTPTAPTGSASALWSVYHPSQAQVDALGAWLWTDNIITQIQQVLQNPMEGIITLHKVFATPVDSGSGTIVIGRLDSQVPSATVAQQYVTVDCGSISCGEYFGSVFDYDPYTRVSLYLPFIGIVPINTSDVMRGTIHVSYGVDVFTGACLAMVEVSRDAHTVNMYQYAGVCSVEYPLTGSVHSGLINGLLGIAGGVAGIAAASTGVGLVAGASAIAGGVASANRASNARASGFSGNAGAMGIKKPYIIIERPQTKVADSFAIDDGYPTNKTVIVGECSGHLKCSTAHIHGVPATTKELEMIESLLMSGIEI